MLQIQIMNYKKASESFKPSQLSKEYNAEHILGKTTKFSLKKRWMIMFNNKDRYLPKVVQRVTCDSNKFYFATVLYLEKSISI